VNTIKRSSFLAGCSALSALLLAAAPALAEEPDAAAEEPQLTAAEKVDHLSGDLLLNVDTNFMSYGFDVWQTGTFHDALFHPQFDLTWDFGNGFSITGGTWWDVNDNADSSISNAIQEVDVWLGAGYTYEKLSVSLTYQEWMYSGDSERIVDLGIAYDTFLSPSLIIHGRVDGNGSQKEGAVFVLGVSHAIEMGSVTLTFPLNVGFVTSGYYQPHQGGFGYTSLGAIASVPISFIPEGYGSWTFNTGLTYYYTDPDNVGNTHTNILTGTMGVALAF
jgi:hypothetical protein